MRILPTLKMVKMANLTFHVFHKKGEAKKIKIARFLGLDLACGLSLADIGGVQPQNARLPQQIHQFLVSVPPWHLGMVSGTQQVTLTAGSCASLPRGCPSGMPGGPRPPGVWAAHEFLHSPGGPYFLGAPTLLAQSRQAAG